LRPVIVSDRQRGFNVAGENKIHLRCSYGFGDPPSLPQVAFANDTAPNRPPKASFSFKTRLVRIGN
jgi:hypothetical protein